MEEIIKLKAEAYDCLALQQQCQVKLNEINQKISELIKAEQETAKE